jgi:hypothetical protein
MSNANDKKPEDREHNENTTIIVNGRPKKWTEETISFEAVVTVAFPDAQPNPNTIYTVTFKKGGDQGSLVAAGSVSVKPGMIFNVTATDKS